MKPELTIECTVLSIKGDKITLEEDAGYCPATQCDRFIHSTQPLDGFTEYLTRLGWEGTFTEGTKFTLEVYSNNTERLVA